MKSISSSIFFVLAMSSSISFAETMAIEKIDLKNKNVFMCLDGSIVEQTSPDSFKLTRPEDSYLEPVEFYKLGQVTETHALEEIKIYGGTNMRDIGIALVASPFASVSNDYYKAFKVEKKISWLNGPSQKMLAIETRESVWNTGRLYHTYSQVYRDMVEDLTKTDKVEFQNITQNRCLRMPMYLAASQNFLGKISGQDVLNLSIAYAPEFADEIKNGFNVAKLNLKSRFSRLSFVNANPHDDNPMALSQGPSLRITSKFIAALDKVVMSNQPLLLKNLRTNELVTLPQEDLDKMTFAKILGHEFFSPLWKKQVEENLSQNQQYLARLRPELLVGAKCYDRFDFEKPDHEVKYIDGKVQYVRNRGKYFPEQRAEINLTTKSYKLESVQAVKDVYLKSEPHYIWKLSGRYSSVYIPLTENLFKFEDRDPDEHFGPDEGYFGFCVKN